MKRLAFMIFCLLSARGFTAGAAAKRLMNQVAQPKPVSLVTPFPSPSPTGPTPVATDTPSAQSPLIKGAAAIAATGVNPVPKGGGLISSIGGGAGGRGGGAGGSGAFSYNSGGGSGGGGDAGGGGGGDGGGGGNKEKPVAFSRWYPMCVFMDGSVSNGNEVVKGLVDMAAKCGVNLVTFPFYTKNMPGGGDGVRNAARNKCNAQDGFRQYGVNRASAIVLSGNRNLAGQLCGASGKDVDLCGEMAYQTDPGTEARIRSTNRWGGMAPPGQPAVGVVSSANGVFDIYKVAAVTGQTFLNRPPGYSGGNGVGGTFEGQAAGGAGATQGWSQDGCQAMQQNSFPNDGRWKYNPEQKDYVVKGDDQKRFLDLGDKKTIFRNPSQTGQGGAQASGGGGMGGSSGGGGGGSSRGGGGGSGSGAGGKAGPGGGAFAFSKKGGGAGGVAVDPVTGRSGRSSASDPLYSDATGGGGESAAAEIPFSDEGIAASIASAKPSVPGMISAKPGGPPGVGGMTLIGYDESASRKGGTFGSALSDAFFGPGGAPAAPDAKKPKNGLDADFFKKILEPEEKQASTWRRKPGSSLRRDPEPSAATSAADGRQGEASALPKRESTLRNDKPASDATAEVAVRPERNGTRASGAGPSRAPASVGESPEEDAAN